MNTFNPKFVRVGSIAECADRINLPHEDYPQRVDRTEFLIRVGVKDATIITEHDCKAYHSYVMHDLQPRYKGCWRNCEVTVNDKAVTPPWMIEGEITEQRLFPMDFTTMDESDIIRWYRTFQIIHPFYDGNGRVGGIIVAIASFINSGGTYYLAPGQ